MKKIISVLRSEKGISLVEILVTIALIAVVSALLMVFFREGLISSSRTIEESELQLDVRHKIDVMINDIRTSKRGEYEGQLFPYIDSADRLILFSGSIDDPKTISYYKSGNTLYRKLDGQDPTMFIENSKVTFSVETDHHIKIIAEIEDTIGYHNQGLEKEIVITAFPRGKIPPH
ncbi:Tfp pilus assembly protein FimT/FimU [Anaerobacillus sp. MEB173]|uniref:pilus assembly FimT family protein n=1 Tax=Anaerobacillus sp. MEB173 TaxID=3383345 RepID=UPI003F8FD467